MIRIGDVMNKKGFTLVELLVVIVIIGLISYIGFPSLMALLENNKTTEFEYYGKLMVDAAKLYAKKESVDWKEESNNNSFTKEVSLNNLIKDEYITRFSGTKKDITCNIDTAAVQVKYNSSNGTYTFKYKIACEDSSKKYTKEYNNEKFNVINKNR